jgi:hypothetical protein
MEIMVLYQEFYIIYGKSPLLCLIGKTIAPGQLSVIEMRRIYERITQHFLDNINATN